jgi:hypothetical protein
VGDAGGGAVVGVAVATAAGAVGGTADDTGVAVGGTAVAIRVAVGGTAVAVAVAVAGAVATGAGASAPNATRRASITLKSPPALRKRTRCVPAGTGSLKDWACSPAPSGR